MSSASGTIALSSGRDFDFRIRIASVGIMAGLLIREFTDDNRRYKLLAPSGDSPSAQKVQTELEYIRGKIPEMNDFRSAHLHLEQYVLSCAGDLGTYSRQLINGAELLL